MADPNDLSQQQLTVSRRINNSDGCQNSYTMNYLLKGELGFQGFIQSDWQATHSGVSSVLAGLDMVRNLSRSDITSNRLTFR